MASTYSPLLRIELQGSGENSTTWGDKTNTNFSVVIEKAIAGASSIVMMDIDYTLSTNFGSADEARSAILLVSGTNTALRNIIVPTASKVYLVSNLTVGGFSVVVKTTAGTGITVPNGATLQLYCDGTNVLTNSISTGAITPSLVSTAGAAWRFDTALGVGHAQPVVANYGVIGINGTTGSYTTYYTNNVQSGTVSGTAAAFDISSPTLPVTITTNGITRMSINNAGACAFGSSVAAVSLSATGAVTGASASFSGAVSALSHSSTNGYSGITSGNVTGALGYTPVQQGTGINQYANTVKIGWSGVGRLKATVDVTDMGNFAMEGTTNTFTQNQTVTGSGSVTLTTGGDITASRSGGTTGVIFLGTTGRYLYWDGANYQLPSGGLSVGGTVYANNYSGISSANVTNALGYVPPNLNASNYFSGLQTADYDGQTNYGSAALMSRSNSGDVHISLHAAGTSACSIKHTRGGNGVSIVDTSGSTLANLAAATITGNTVQELSDERDKSNWQPLVDFVKKLAKIKKSGLYDRDGKTYAGAGAQSIRKILPQVVNKGKDGKLTVSYGAAAFVSSVELAKYVVALEARLAKLEAKK